MICCDDTFGNHTARQQRPLLSRHDQKVVTTWRGRTPTLTECLADHNAAPTPKVQNLARKRPMN